MAYYECANIKHTVTVNIQMGWTSGGHHQCTASVYNDGELIDTLNVAQYNNTIGLPRSLSRNYII